ncbi:MAG: glycosyltransferase family 4 protein [Deltaproteobacteria bacterium]|nr:glycosyltransferase family 4 protein [Deltaproteobacteria bacterium]
MTMTDDMTIAYLCPDVGVPVLGFKGCSVHVREMCSALASLGADVSIYALLKGQGNWCSHMITEVQPFKAKWMGRDSRLILSNFKLYQKCKKQFRKKKPNLIYERYGLYGWAGIRLAKEFSVPIVLEVNSLLAEKEKNRLHFPNLAKTLENSIMKKATAVCCPSKVMKSLLLKRGLREEKILITPNGIDFKKFDIGMKVQKTDKLDKLHGKIVVGFVGSIRGFLGIDLILESAQHILSQRKDIHYLVIGDGRAFPDVKAYIRDNGLADQFTLTGGIPHTDIPKYIAAMDIGLAPYRHKEPFHNSAMKIFEYMAMAKPVIASAQGQIKDIIRHKKNGLLVEPDDCEGLTRAILELVDQESVRQNMGLNARATVERGYTWEANASKVLAICRSSLVEAGAFPDHEK